MKKLILVFGLTLTFFYSENINAQAPSNDDPCNAITLSVGTTCNYTQFTTANATATTGVPIPGCANYIGGDVWFSAVVPASGSIIFDTNTGVITDGGMALYTGTCNALTLIACDDDASINGLMPAITQSGLNPGTTIYVRVWEYGNDVSGTFSICTRAGIICNSSATNNSCLSASTMCSGDTIACCNTINVPSIGQGFYPTGEGYDSKYGCLGSAVNPAFFYFNVGVSGAIGISISQQTYCGAGIDVDYILWGPFSSPSTICSEISSTNIVGCSYQISSVEYVNIPSAIVGQWYMLLVTNYSNQPGSIQIMQATGAGAIGAGATITANGPTTFCAGGSVLLTASSGTSYQWYKNNVTINGATNQSYTATTTATYKALVNSICGSATSSDVQVVKNSLPTVSISAVGSTTICSGDSVLLTSTVSPLTVTYQWLKANAAISGATNSFYNAKTSGKYSVTVTNITTGCTKTSSQILVTVKALPSASITPAGSVTICAGDVLSLTAVSNTGNQFQWKKNGTTISGATNQTYNATVAGAYRVFITNSFGCQKLSAQKIITTMVCRLDEYENISSDVIKVYPNPTDGSINISSTLAIDKIECFNSLGQLVFQKPFQTQIDLSEYVEGNYLMKLDYENGNEYKIYKVLLVK